MLLLVCADARHIPLADQSVHCVITSPPYWGLRDYGLPGQLGLERTPREYISNMVAVFREVWRVLRDDGTAWVNMGDSYAAERWGKGTAPPPTNTHNKTALSMSRGGGHLKPKDLCGIPWRLAFALQEAGWYLRSDIIWAKPNPMPESVTDRPTKSHEYVFLLSKNERYFYDAEAVKEKAEYGYRNWSKQQFKGGDITCHHGKDGGSITGANPAAGRNLRSVWNIATQPYSGAHFATFPEKLVEPCIRAGTSERGVCVQCGAPWERVTRSSVRFESGSGNAGNPPAGKNGSEYVQAKSGDYDIRMGPVVESQTLGFRPTCLCPGQHGKTKPGIVLDPFGGSGTVGRVAIRLRRRAILLDIGYGDKYAPLAKERTSKVQLEFA